MGMNVGRTGWETRRPGPWWRRRPPGPGRRRHAGIMALVLIAAVLGHGSPARAQSSLPGGLFLPGDGRWEAAPRVTADAYMDVTGLVARVEVRQTFSNPGQEWTEGVYVFPLPTDAAVDTLELKVAGRWIQGEIREREAALAAYNAARDTGRRAGLVEQDRPNLFSLSVANIPPGETVYVRIGYFQRARFEDGGFELTLPLTVTPRYLPRAAGEGAVAGGGAPAARPEAYTTPGPDTGHLGLTVRLRAGLPVDSVDGAHHPMTVVADDGGGLTLVPAAGRLTMDRDFVLRWRPVPGTQPVATVFSERFGDEIYDLVMILPPAADGRARVGPRDVILVLDTSGSMAGASIAQAKAALDLALTRLQPDDRFNLVRFASDAEALHPGPVAATADNVEGARRWLGGLAADGGTEMADALALALAGSEPGRLRQVVFVTDGAVGNEEALFGLIERGLGDARLFTVGIGAAPNRHFMEKAARHGRGSHVQVARLEEVGERMATLFRRLETPALTDLELSWPGDPGAEIWPGRIADLYWGEPVVVTARRQPGPGWVHLAGRAAGGHWLRQLPLPEGGDAPGVAAVWARMKLDALEDRLVGGGDGEAVREAMVAVALEHGLVSRYTSLVAVERAPSRPAWARTSSHAVPRVPPAGGVALGGLPATATDAPVHLLRGLALLAAALLLAFHGGRRTPAWD